MYDGKYNRNLIVIDLSHLIGLHRMQFFTVNKRFAGRISSIIRLKDISCMVIHRYCLGVELRFSRCRGRAFHMESSFPPNDTIARRDKLGR